MPRISLVMCYCILLTASTENCDCVLPFGGKWNDKKQPMLLKNQNRVVTIDKEIKFRNGETVEFACPGRNNYLFLTNTYIFRGQCAEGENFYLNGEIQSFSNIQCNDPIKAQAKNLGECCSQGGTMFQIRFVLPFGFYPQFTVCYDLANLNPLYSRFEIIGRSAGFSTTTKPDSDFSTEGLGNNEVKFKYSKKNQRDRFKFLLGATKARTYIKKKSSFLARGHLATKSHFVFSYEQLATYFYLNVAPQWQQANGAYWNSVEKTIRSHIGKEKESYEIIAGTHGLLTLNDENNNPVPIYLHEDNKMPVPKYIWKIMRRLSNNDAIVFVQINNPFTTNPQNQVFCKNVCGEAGLNKQHWSYAKKGFVFCCSLNEFYNEVHTAPPLQVGGLIHF